MPVHRDIKNGGHAEYWLYGGRGSTKSSFASIEIVLGILRNPNANAIIYRKVAATLRESVYEQMLWAIDRMGVAQWFRYKLSPLEIIYKPTGQRVLFRGADDPSKSKSIKLSKGYFKYLWFEELTEFSGMEDVRTIKASIIRGGGRAFTFYSYNPPKSANNWTNAEALIPRADRLTHHSSYLDVPREWLGESFLAEAEALKSTNEQLYKNMYLGIATGTGGHVFDNLILRRLTTDEIQTFDHFYNGLDFGFAVAPDAFVRWYYHKASRCLILMDEYYGVRTPTDALAEATHQRAGREIVACDSADPRMISELNRRGVRAMGAKKGPGSIEHGMRWLQELGGIIIDPARCPNATREFSGYEYKQDRFGNFMADYPDVDNHLIDATRYAIESIVKTRKLKTMDRSLLGL